MHFDLLLCDHNLACLTAEKPEFWIVVEVLHYEELEESKGLNSLEKPVHSALTVRVRALSVTNLEVESHHRACELRRSAIGCSGQTHARQPCRPTPIKENDFEANPPPKYETYRFIYEY